MESCDGASCPLNAYLDPLAFDAEAATLGIDLDAMCADLLEVTAVLLLG
jgi:hypothetical protein